MIFTDGVQKVIVMATYPTRIVPMITIEYLASIRNDEIPTWPIDNESFYNKIHTKHVETLERNHYIDFKTIHVNFGAKKNVIIDLDVEVQVNLISSVVTIKWLPPDPRKDPPKPPRGVTITSMQPALLYFRPFNTPLNYLKYKKDFDPDVHVRIFKTIIKFNNEMINEQIVNLFNFTIRNNAYDWCNNYMWDHPNCRFVDLEQTF
jgi:hypothetical protein